jgi:arylsulfatase A-like enzyme
MDTPAENAKLPEFIRESFLGVAYKKEFNVGGDPNGFLRGYFRKIASVERSVAAITRMLEERGLAENTVVIFLSDHGVHFGERQLYGKWTPYDASLRIPFLVRDPRPGGARGVASDQIALNIDVAPTLLDLAGIPVPASMDGRSLAPILRGETAAPRDHFFLEHYTSPAGMPYIPRNIGIRTRTAKFFRWIDPQAGGVESLYDLAADPMESRDLLSDPEHSAEAARLRSALDEWRSSHPSNYEHSPCGPRPGSLAPSIDWGEFAKARPKEFQAIKAEVERLGVTWEEAMDDWPTRREICRRVGYWY